jgi:hypothetical protein
MVSLDYITKSRLPGGFAGGRGLWIERLLSELSVTIFPSLLRIMTIKVCVQDQV